VDCRVSENFLSSIYSIRSPPSTKYYVLYASVDLQLCRFATDNAPCEKTSRNHSSSGPAEAASDDDNAP